MTDYKKVLDQQLDTLDKTIKMQNKDYIKKEGGLVNKISHIAYTRPEMFKTGAKLTAITGLGYILGGPLGVALGFACYAGKKYIYDPRVKKEKQNKESHK